MSSFEQPHSLFLFELVNGKKKLLYGASPEHALEIARIRLGEDEMKAILPERYTKILQRDLMKHVRELG